MNFICTNKLCARPVSMPAGSQYCPGCGAVVRKLGSAKLERLRERWLGQTWSVWWDTGDDRPSGQHRAIIMEVSEYTGRYDWIACVFKLAAPNTRRGWLEMTIPKIDLKHAEA